MLSWVIADGFTFTLRSTLILSAVHVPEWEGNLGTGSPSWTVGFLLQRGAEAVKTPADVIISSAC